MDLRVISIASVTTPMLHRLGQGLAGMALRLDTPLAHALALAPGGAGWRGRPAAFTPRRRQGLIERALSTMQDIYVLARHADAGRPEVREAELAEARLQASRWQGRAESAEDRISELERRLAAAEMAALDLRARVVCLHGKLATSTATARYQTLALALETQTRGEEDAGEASWRQRAPA